MISMCRNLIATYANRPCLSLLILGFAAGLPYALLFTTLGMWLREAGFDVAQIAYLSLIGIAYSFKWIWAPVLDGVKIPYLYKLGRRKSYLIISQIVVLIGIVAVVLCSYFSSFYMLFALCFVIACASATQDSVIDAYRLEIAPEQQQAALAACYMLGYRLALLISGAGALFLAQQFGSSMEHYSANAWQKTYLIMAGCFAPLIIISFLLDEPVVQVSSSVNSLNVGRQLLSVISLIVLLVALSTAIQNLWLIKAQGFNASFSAYAILGISLIVIIIEVNFARYLFSPIWQPISDFIGRYQKQAILLLALIATYRMSDMVLGVMANIFYLDIGFSKEQIASVSKVFGLVMTLLGSLIGGVLVVRFNVLKVMLLGAILCPATNLLFYVLSIVGANLQFLVITISIDNLSAGIATAAFVAYLSSLTNLKFSASQYALLSSIMLLLPRFVGGYSGVMVQNVGYGNFFLITAIIGIPAIILIILQMRSKNV